MAHIPIDLPSQSVHIHAQRELAFEVISAYGTGDADGARNAGDKKPTARVIEESDGKNLVEFHTPLKFGPLKTTFRSTEWVATEPPSSMMFELVPGTGLLGGGLRQLSDRFDFEEEGNCTVLTYSSRFGIRWSVGGWVLGKILIGPIVRRHMVVHLRELKEIVENRARRSKVYPQQACRESGEVKASTY